MPTTILLIENDAGFTREITEALEAAGFQVRVTGDGKEGLDLAREVTPAAIVLCVELPKMSGYSICQKLKKDDALRGIPLILTSAEATAETFEQHKKLKARAEEYLLKPYSGADLVAKLTPFTGQPEAPLAEEPGEEEVVSLEEELGLEALGGEPDGELPALDLGSLPDEPVQGGDAATRAGEDEDLRLLDDAFAGLSTPPATTPAPLPPVRSVAAPPDPGAELDLALEGDLPVESADIDAAAASLPLEDEAPARAQLDSMDDEADLALGSLGADESPAAALDALDALDGPPADRDAPGPLDLDSPAGGTALDFAPELAAALDLAPEAPVGLVRGASADALRAVGIALLDDAPPAPAPTLKIVPPPDAPPEPSPAADPRGGPELARLQAELTDRRAALAARDAELGDLHDRVDALTRRAMDAESALAERAAEVASLRARAEALATQVKRGEAELKTGRDEARRAAEQVRAAEDRARAAEAQATTIGERARAAEVQAAAAAEKTRAAEAQAAAATAEAGRHRAAAADAARGLAAKVAELAAAADAAARLSGVEREVEELRTELIVAQGEVEGARSEVEKRSAELRKRISELEAGNSKNEERVVKAYLKIKGDEKVRDKARKALAIALQLLEEGLPPEAGAPRPPAPGAKLE